MAEHFTLINPDKVQTGGQTEMLSIVDAKIHVSNSNCLINGTTMLFPIDEAAYGMNNIEITQQNSHTLSEIDLQQDQLDVSNPYSNNKLKYASNKSTCWLEDNDIIIPTTTNTTTTTSYSEISHVDSIPSSNDFLFDEDYYDDDVDDCFPPEEEGNELFLDDFVDQFETELTIAAKNIKEITPHLEDNYSNLLDKPLINTEEHVVHSLIAQIPNSKAHLYPITFYRDSLFPGVPPTLNFPLLNEIVDNIPSDVISQLKWRPSPITPNVIKNCIHKSGFKMSNSSEWIGYFGRHMKASSFKQLKPYQKFNHLPGSFQIGRKDNLWKSIYRMQLKYTKKEFNFVPHTYILPTDYEALKLDYEQKGSKARWIMKPPASARGNGIQMVRRFSQIPKNRNLLIQQYISDPLVINDSKCDLRVYVFVPSMDPLRIYVYDDGLVRFATGKYSTAAKNLSDRFVHLTNYSVNKKSGKFQQNSDETIRQGHKWGLKALWPYLRERGVDADKVWLSIHHLVVKTILSVETYINSQIKANLKQKQCVYELFGFDIMLDSKYKPWLIEVNISPSLHSNSRLDVNIKEPMMASILNMLQFRLPNKELPYTQLSHDERCKHAHYIQTYNYNSEQIPILGILTPDDIRILIETEDEYERRGNFQRVFPNIHSASFLRYFTPQRYYNLLLHAWLDSVSHSRDMVLMQKLSKLGIPFTSAPPIAHIWSAHFKLNLTIPKLFLNRGALQTVKLKGKTAKKKVSKVDKH